MHPKRLGMAMIAVLAAIAAGALIAAIEQRTLERYQDRTARYGRFLADHLWNLDLPATNEYLTVIARAHALTKIEVRHANGGLFAATETTQKQDGGVRQTLWAAGIYRPAPINVPLTYEGDTIGHLRIEWINRNGTLYSYGFLVLGLLLAAAWYAGDAVRNRKAWTYERDAKKAADRANRLKSEFLATMSHEIRTPLNVMLGYVHLLERDGRIDAHLRREAFAKIEQAGDRLLETIDKLIDMSRLQLDDFPFDAEPLDLNAVMAGCIRELTPLAERKSLDLLTDFPSEQLVVYFDPYALRHALSNVIENAIKYTEQGSVRIRIGQAPPWAVIEVIDTGVGIDRNYLPRVFDHFSQEYSGYDRPYEGTGLGLAISKRFLAGGGGTIALDSKKGAGTHVTIRVPLASEHSPAPNIAELSEPTAQSTPATGPSTPRRILLVEDDADTQAYLSLALSATDEVDIAANAESALRKLRERRYDLVLMDLSLSGSMDGAQLTRHIRDQGPQPLIPVIALTAHALERDREFATQAGCNAFLVKPCPLHELTATIDTVLHAHNAGGV